MLAGNYFALYFLALQFRQRELIQLNDYTDLIIIDIFITGATDNDTNLSLSSNDGRTKHTTFELSPNLAIGHLLLHDPKYHLNL
jgi:hypothetical protein